MAPDMEEASCVLISDCFSLSRSEPESFGVGNAPGRVSGNGGGIESMGVSPIEGKRFLLCPPGVLTLRLFRVRSWGLRYVLGVPPGDKADSAMGVIPGAFVGVRSSDNRPGNLNLASDFPKEVMSLSEAFLAVSLDWLAC